MCFMFIYGVARRCPLSGGTQLVHPGKTRPQKRYIPFRKGGEKFCEPRFFHLMARPGLSEAVDALHGIPEKRCFRTLREHETTSRDPMETTLRRRPTEERLVVSKNDFERHPLEHPNQSARTRSARTAR
jgi:hypothetical protein